MRRQGSGFGFVILLVVLTVVLLLASRAWKRVMPAAAAVAKPAPPAESVEGPPEGSGSGRTVDPSLRRMKQGTDKHSGQVQDALQQTE